MNCPEVRHIFFVCGHEFHKFSFPIHTFAVREEGYDELRKNRCKGSTFLYENEIQSNQWRGQEVEWLFSVCSIHGV